MPAKSRQKKPDQRTPLNPERVFRTAVALADKRGVEALSMRALAAELGFGVMSLYNHVANKDEVFEGMAELVANEIEAPTSGNEDWKAAMREIAVSAHHVLLRHPWAAAKWSNVGPGPKRLRHMEAILRCLREAGFSAEVACRGFHAISTHILGFTLQKLDFPLEREELPDAARAFLKELSTDEFPYFAEHVRQHIDGPNHGDDFEFVLDLILEGLERGANTDG